MNCDTHGCGRPSYVKGLCKTHYHRGKTREWRANNRARYLENARQHDAKRRQDPKRRAHMAGYLNDYVNTEHGKEVRRQVLRRYQKRRHQAELQATPLWVSADELNRIHRERPPGHDVDHIVPVLGRNVCGLNVPWNLQYLPSAENRRKGNREAK